MLTVLENLNDKTFATPRAVTAALKPLGFDILYYDWGVVEANYPFNGTELYCVIYLKAVDDDFEKGIFIEGVETHDDEILDKLCQLDFKYNAVEPIADKLGSLGFNILDTTDEEVRVSYKSGNNDCSVIIALNKVANSFYVGNYDFV